LRTPIGQTAAQEPPAVDQNATRNGSWALPQVVPKTIEECPKLSAPFRTAPFLLRAEANVFAL
jgi:hypothetical protein